MKIEVFNALKVKIKSIIAELRTPRGAAILAQKQEANDETIRKLLLPGETRWDSEYDSFLRVQGHMSSVEAALRFRGKLTLKLSVQEETLLTVLMNLLRPLKELTMLLQRRDTCISSVHMALMKMMKNEYDETASYVPHSIDETAAAIEVKAVQDFKRIITQEMKSRLSASYLAPLSPGVISSVLREQYKDLRYLDEAEKARTHAWIREFMLRCRPEFRAASASQTDVTETLTKKSSNSYSIDDFIARDAKAPVGSTVTQAMPDKEFEDYMSFATEDSGLSSIDYWYKHGHRFPSLCLLAKRLLSAQPTTSECERVWSQTELTSTLHRSNMGERTLEDITFIKCNDPDIRRGETHM
jgi:hypothetical protein